MIETTNPEIDVNALMERVRNEAARLASREITRTAVAPRNRRPGLPNIREVAPPPDVGFSKPFDPKRERLDGALQRARRAIETGSWVPKILRGFFRSQGGFNRAVLDAAAVLMKNDLQLSKRVHELVTATEQHNQWLRHLTAHRQTEILWIKGAAPLISGLAALQDRVAELEQQLAKAAIRAGDDASALEEHRRTFEEHVRAFGEHARESKTWIEEVARHGQHLRGLQNEASRVAEELRPLLPLPERFAATVANVELRLQHFAQVQLSLARLEERQASDAIYIKSELSQQRASLQRLTDGTVTAPTISTSADQVSSELDHSLDSFYLSFENRFRGDRSEIKERVRFYLPMLRKAKAGSHGRPILDVGCGRGEWLELLQENGLEAAGVDLNRAMTAQCQQRGLAVTEADAIAYLRNLPDESVGAVTGFHIIEHLPLSELVALLSETLRVLKPGGLAIFESPNCKNLTVGASYFNIDPTHRNPIYPETAQFMLETEGFEKVRLEYLSPSSSSPFSGEDPNVVALNGLFYGPQDFAVIGRKTAGG